MDEMLLKYLISGAVTLFTAIITTFLVPALKNWVTNTKNEKILKFIQNTVKAAEQIYGSGTGSTKKEYVITLVRSKFKKLGFTDSELDTLIESAVYEVSGAFKTMRESMAEEDKPKSVVSEKSTVKVLKNDKRETKSVSDISSISSI